MSRHRKDRLPDEQDTDSYMKMNGQAVFKFAVKKVPEAVLEVLSGAGRTADEVDYFVLHQRQTRGS